jgi:hypothetical protein
MSIVTTKNEKFLQIYFVLFFIQNSGAAVWYNYSENFNGYTAELVQADRFMLCMDSAKIVRSGRLGCA